MEQSSNLPSRSVLDGAISMWFHVEKLAIQTTSSGSSGDFTAVQCNLEILFQLLLNSYKG